MMASPIIHAEEGVPPPPMPPPLPPPLPSTREDVRGKKRATTQDGQQVRKCKNRAEAACFSEACDEFADTEQNFGLGCVGTWGGRLIVSHCHLPGTTHPKYICKPEQRHPKASYLTFTSRFTSGVGGGVLPACSRAPSRRGDERVLLFLLVLDLLLLLLLLAPFAGECGQEDGR